MKITFEKFKRKAKKAITLSEVLIAIGVLGIIAILTIPKIMQHTANKDLVAQYLKSNNVLTNAYKTAGSLSGFNLSRLQEEDFKLELENQLKILGVQGENCERDICLADGGDYSYQVEQIEGENGNYVTALTVDTNGTNRKPNLPGKDLFKFLVTEDGLVAEGNQEVCGILDDGLDCGKYVLTYHKLFDGLVDNCAKYDQGRCIACDNGEKGYKLEDNKCLEVKIPHCKKYGANGNDSVCIQCDEKSLLTDGTCTLMKDLNCKATEDGKTCSECMDKYTNDHGVCKEIDIPNCKEYIGDKCLDCKLGFFISADGSVCFPAIEHCDVQTANICNECEKNYIGNGTTACAFCGEGKHSFQNQCYPDIENCKDASYGATCSSCSTGYHLAQNKGTCYQNVENCENNLDGKCTRCKNGYSVASSGQCSQCAAGAASNDGLTCKACSDHSISTAGSSLCKPCGSGEHSQDHITCHKNVANCVVNFNGVCQKCESGYKLTNGTCTACLAGTYGVDGLNCTACQNNTFTSVEGQSSCKACDSGFHAATDHKKCYKTPEHCTTFADGKCTLCNTGYKLDESNGTCSACNSGEYGNDGKTCSTCADNTKSAAGAASCTACPSGQHSQDHINCYANVANCQTNSNGKCTLCNKGYRIDNGQCTACGNSYYGADGKVCSPCDAGTGHKLTAQQAKTSCVACGTNEVAATAGAVCTSCGSGKHTQNHTTCYADITGCVTHNNDKCIKCAAGYKLENGSCTKCSAGTYAAEGATTCSTCADNTKSAAGAASCTPCPSGQHSQDHINCYANVAGCATNVNGKCTRCNGGYRLSAGTCTQCTAGTYAAAGSTSCSNCADNTTSAAGAASCTACPSGQHSQDHINCYANIAGCQTHNNGTCTTCSAGYRKSGTTCIICSAGTYAQYAGSTSCSTCADNTTSAAGAASCTPCPSGQHSQDHINCYANKTGCQTHSNGTCTRCNGGYRLTSGSCTQCTAGTAAAEGSTSCTSCSAWNSYSSSAGATSCSTCGDNCQANSGHTGCVCCKYGTLSGGACIYTDQRRAYTWSSAQSRCSSLGYSFHDHGNTLTFANNIGARFCFWSNSTSGNNAIKVNSGNQSRAYTYWPKGNAYGVLCVGSPE